MKCCWCRPARPYKMTGVVAWDVVGMRGSGRQMADRLALACWFPPFPLPSLLPFDFFPLSNFLCCLEFPVFRCLDLSPRPQSLFSPISTHLPSRICLVPCLLKKGSSSWEASTSTPMSRHSKTTSAALGLSLRWLLSRTGRLKDPGVLASSPLPTQSMPQMP